MRPAASVDDMTQRRALDGAVVESLLLGLAVRYAWFWRRREPGLAA